MWYVICRYAPHSIYIWYAFAVCPNRWCHKVTHVELWRASHMSRDSLSCWVGWVFNQPCSWERVGIFRICMSRRNFAWPMNKYDVGVLSIVKGIVPYHLGHITSSYEGMQDDIRKRELEFEEDRAMFILSRDASIINSESLRLRLSVIIISSLEMPWTIPSLSNKVYVSNG